MSKLGMSIASHLHLAAVGDIALTHRYSDELRKENGHYPFSAVEDIFRKCDIVLGNLEAPLCKAGETYPTKCSLRGDPVFAGNMKNSGINILSLSNNHILDYKGEGLFETIRILDEHGIKHFGAGKNLAEARSSAVIEKKGIRIGFLGYCDVVIDSPFYASEKERGIAPLTLSYVKEDIEHLRKKVDIVIISLHWGVENYSYPSPKQISIAHQLVNWGCDLIVGHHPHVLQGVEKYKEGYIAYSLGNFAFCDIDWAWTRPDGQEVKSHVQLNRKNRESMILVAELAKNGIRGVDLLPCFIGRDYRVELLPNTSKFRKKISKLSRKMSHKNYPAFWKRYSFIQKLKDIIMINTRRLGRIHRMRPSRFRDAIRILGPSKRS